MHIRSIVAPLLKWFAGNARDLPWRWTRDPYAIWVSEIMLQQTQVSFNLGLGTMCCRKSHESRQFSAVRISIRRPSGRR